LTAVRHLYLHVPFCSRRCPYCDYAVTVDATPDLDAWSTALGHELDLRRESGVTFDSLATILIGGGTPSLLGAGAMERVRSIFEDVDFGGVEEWTVEANPEHVDAALLGGWKHAGVTRVSIGVQSLHAPVLTWLGRSHDPAQGAQALERADRAGLPSWGVDLLYGLPEDIDPDPRETLREVLAVGVPHVSLYELVAEPGTPLGDRLGRGEVQLADDDTRADQFLALRAMLVAEGYEHYELTGFARPGHRSRHMTGILSGGSWLGLGPGAHSNLEGLRSWNLNDWRGYSTSVAQGVLPRAEAVRLDADDEREERFRARLCSAEGLPLADLGPRGCALAESWVERGLAIVGAETVRLTAEGWLRLDELAPHLARAEADSGYLSEVPSRRIIENRPGASEHHG
jgi:oxygen-independent coproporphyrinogen-3 oxidase